MALRNNTTNSIFSHLCDVFQLEADLQAPTSEHPHLRLTAANKRVSHLSAV